MRSARKLAITTPIFYVNDNPHIGHLYTMLYADILARRARITRGHDSVMMFTGTDEHGQKIQSAAERQGLSPIDFCDKYSNMFKILADKAEISYNGFIRTTQVSHIKNVQNFWTAIQKNGLISKSKPLFFILSPNCV